MQQVSISVKFDGVLKKVSLNTRSTVADLKELLHSETEVPSHNQGISMGGVPCDDNSSVLQHICNQDLHLESYIPHRLYHVIEGSNIAFVTLNLLSTTAYTLTAYEWAQAIGEIYGFKSGSVQVNGKQLEDDDCVLKDVANDANITVMPSSGSKISWQFDSVVWAGGWPLFHIPDSAIPPLMKEQGAIRVTFNDILIVNYYGQSLEVAKLKEWISIKTGVPVEVQTLQTEDTCYGDNALLPQGAYKLDLDQVLTLRLVGPTTVLQYSHEMGIDMPTLELYQYTTSWLCSKVLQNIIECKTPYMPYINNQSVSLDTELLQLHKGKVTTLSLMFRNDITIKHPLRIPDLNNFPYSKRNLIKMLDFNVVGASTHTDWERQYYYNQNSSSSLSSQQISALEWQQPNVQVQPQAMDVDPNLNTTGYGCWM